MINNLHYIISNHNLSNYNIVAQKLVDFAQKKSYEIFQNSMTSLSSSNTFSRDVCIGIAIGASIFLVGQLFNRFVLQSKSKETAPRPNHHLVTLREAARKVLKGHKYDSTDPKNLFYSDHESPSRPFDCLTKKETNHLKRFLTPHLTSNFKNKTKHIIKKIQVWGLSINGLHYASCFVRGAPEVQRFVMSLGWNLFLGNSQPPKSFCPSIVDNEREYTIEDLDILKEAMEMYGITDDSTILGMVDEFKPGFLVLSTLLTTVLSRLSTNRELQDAVYEDLRTLKNDKHSLKNNQSSLQNAVNKSRLLFQIIAETLRTFSGLQPIKREKVRKEFILKNPTPDQKLAIVKPEDTVLIDFREIKMDQNIVGSEPEKFDLTRDCLRKNNFRDLIWLPFGTGGHPCPAAGVVQKLSTLIIGTLIYHFRFSVEENKVKTTQRL